MKEGFERLKSKNWFKHNRELLDYALDKLNDAEFKLWVGLQGAAFDFEGPNLGQVRVTVALINRRLNWSQGKSSKTLSGLLQKTFVRQFKRGLYYVSQTLLEVQNNEHLTVRIYEHKVHSGEVNVQSDEQVSFEPQSYKSKESHSLTPSKELSPEELERIWKEICEEGQQ